MKPINIPPFKVGDRVYSETWKKTRTVDIIERDGGVWWFFEAGYLCLCDDYERINEETPDQRPEVQSITHNGVTISFGSAVIDNAEGSYRIQPAVQSSHGRWSFQYDPSYPHGIRIVYDTPPTASGSEQSGTDGQ